MLVFLVQLSLLFTVYILGVRFLGRSALAQMTPHDFAAIIFLAYITFGPIKVDSIEKAIIGLVVVIFIHILIGRLTLLNKINRLIIGEPLILIKNGRLIPSHLKKTRFPLIELLAALRSSGFLDINHIQYAILEANGKISILPKKEFAPLTPKDMKVKVSNNETPISVIVEGKIQEKNLKLLHKDKEWLIAELDSQGYKNLKEIFFATVTAENYILHIYLYDSNRQTERWS